MMRVYSKDEMELIREGNVLYIIFSKRASSQNIYLHDENPLYTAIN